MKIRNKLILIITGLFIGLLISFGGYFMFQKIIDITEKEKSELLLLKDRVQAEHISLSNFLYSRVVVFYQLEEFNKKVEAKEIVLENVKAIKILPKINSDIKEALNIIVLLSNLQDKFQKELNSEVNVFGLLP
ncbi:MAG: hypothetical protein B6229_09260 [Spirochaetaceae bacterium 4572_7]|nr:MAG: hypothetical protein B6229_09260 [Spirochaetaceae bacterium 4572_7]